MHWYHLIGYPLFFIAFLELLLGVVFLRGTYRKSRVHLSAAVFSFFSAAFALSAAFAYLRASRGLDISFFLRALWIGWFMVPAGLQFIYALKDETGRAVRVVGYTLYPFWSIIFLLCLFTNLIEPGTSTLVPYVGHRGPLDGLVRLIGVLMVVWAISEVVRLRKRVFGRRKTQLDYFLAGLLIFGVGGGTVAGLLPLVGITSVDPALAAFFSLPWVVLTWYAATRYRLFGIRRMIEQTFTLSLLAVLVIGLILLLFRLLEHELGIIPALFVALAGVGLLLFAIGSRRAVQAWIRRRLFRRAYDYETALSETVYGVTTMLDLDELLAFIVTRLWTILETEGVHLYLKSADASCALRQSAGRSEPDTCAWLPEVVLQHLCSRHAVVVVTDELELAARGREADPLVAALRDTGIAAAVPLVTRDQFQGVLTLAPKRSRDAFTQDDVNLLTALAGNAAVAIENAVLYAEMEQKVHDRTRELEKAKIAAEEANRAKSEFLSNISHELRTPLNSIIGFSEAMKDGSAGPLSSDQLGYLQDIWESGKHLLRIINNILDLSKIEAGMMELELDDFFLKELLEGSLGLFRERAKRQGITLIAEIADDVDLVTADATRIKQVALNLLANAVKFTPDGGRVGVRAFRDGGAVQVEVWDTGIGMTPEDSAKLFQPFQQLDNSLTKKFEGTGLGLHLSRKIIELHGGTIWVESAPGQGSRFIFTLPQPAGGQQGPAGAGRG